MQSSLKNKPEQIDVLLFEAFSNHCLANTIEPLRAANALSGQTLYNWRVCTLDSAPVRSSSGLHLTPDGAPEGGDMLVVMPSYGVRALPSRATSRALGAAARNYARLAGFDTGSWLLAQAGLLDRYRATIHWDELASFSETFTEVDTVQERYVIDRDRITCSGAAAAFDLVLSLVAKAHGPLLAMDVAQLFMTPEAATAPVPHRGHGRIVQRALAIMQDTVEAPISVPAIARHAGCTQKTLETHMKNALKATPQAVYRRLRLSRARQLISATDLPVAEIAGRCGYDNASAMTRAFRATYGQTPRNMRMS